MGSGKGSARHATDMMLVQNMLAQQQMQRQQENFNRQMAEQKKQTERATTQSEQATNASQKANAMSTNNENLGIRTQGQLAQQGSANETIKDKLGGGVTADENKKKEAWY